MNAAHSLSSNTQATTLTDIYRDDVTLAVWQRQLDCKIKKYAQHLLTVAPKLQMQIIQKTATLAQSLERELPLSEFRQAFIDDITLVVDMYSCLFDLDHVGLRMAVLNKAMCPKFHVDRVPCRLITTYIGAGTQWHLPENIERLENGRVMPKPNAHYKSLHCGDVALLKGESWEGNHGRGLVHRSPAADDNTARLVLTLDFA